MHPADTGNFLTGLGTLIASIVGALTFLVGFLNRKEIKSWFSSRSQLTHQNQILISELVQTKRRAEAAEQRAENWEAGAQGAKFNAQEVMERLAAVEQEAKEAKEIIPKFNALVDFTKRLLRHAVTLRQQLTAAGHAPNEPLPAVPEELADKLTD